MQSNILFFEKSSKHLCSHFFYNGIIFYCIKINGIIYAVISENLF